MSWNDEGPHGSKQTDFQKRQSSLKRESETLPPSDSETPPCTKAITIDQIEALLDIKLDVFQKAIAQEVHSMVMKEVNR